MSLTVPAAGQGRAELLRECRALYAGGPGAARAEAHLRAMGRDRLRARLDGLRQLLHRGTDAYESAAYTGAYFGLDVPANITRMLVVLAPPATTRDQDYRAEGSATNLVQVIAAVERVYERHPSKAALRAIYVFDAEGDATEAQDRIIADLFLRHPADSLRAARHTRPVGPVKDGLEQLGYALADAASGEGALRTRLSAMLSPLAGATDRRLSRAAAAVRRTYEQALKND